MKLPGYKLVLKLLLLFFFSHFHFHLKSFLGHSRLRQKPQVSSGKLTMVIFLRLENNQINLFNNTVWQTVFFPLYWINGT